MGTIFNMNSHLNKSDQRSIFSDLKAEYLYVCIPFILLILVKVYFGSSMDIILSSDWSLASSILLGQNASRVSRAVAKSTLKTNGSNYSWYSAKRFLYVMISLFFYFGMIFKPTLELGLSQFAVFLLASYLHFTDGFTIKLLEASSHNKKQSSTI